MFSQKYENVVHGKSKSNGWCNRCPTVKSNNASIKAELTDPARQNTATIKSILVENSAGTHPALKLTDHHAY